VEDYLPSSRYSPVMTMFHDHDLVNYCTASNDEIRTYDNVTYQYQMHDCWTLISADCSENPMFALFMKKDTSSKVVLKIVLEGQVIEIKSSGYSRYDLNVNGEEIDLDEHESFLYPSKETVHSGVTERYKFRIHHWDNTFSVDIPFVLLINYDGSQVQVKASPFLKGKQCGMCGDFDRSKRFEFRGPQECLLNDGNEMAAAYAWEDGETCPEKPECADHEDNFSKIVHIY